MFQLFLYGRSIILQVVIQVSSYILYLNTKYVKIFPYLYCSGANYCHLVLWKHRLNLNTRNKIVFFCHLDDGSKAKNIIILNFYQRYFYSSACLSVCFRTKSRNRFRDKLSLWYFLRRVASELNKQHISPSRLLT